MLLEWEAIAPPSDPGSCNVRLADSGHPLDFRIGRDHHGRFVFQLDGECADHRTLDLPKISAMTCEVAPVADGRCRFILCLVDAADFQNFGLMCRSLMLATEKLSPFQSRRGFLQAIEEVHRWQEMLRQRSDRVLSKSERIGLLGELLFLRDVLAYRHGWDAAIRFWNGPAGHEQDFVVAGNLFEVKTQVVTADRRIRISSEDQLDPVQGRIFLCNQGIAPLVLVDPAALTLNRLVLEIRDAVAKARRSTVEILDIALLRAGYEMRKDYDEEGWLFLDRTYYTVCGDFPRIERGDLRPGVEMVKYRIRVSDCVPFTVSEDDAFGGIAL